MIDKQEPVAWAVVDDQFNTGAFAVYLDQSEAEERKKSAERDGPCHVVKLVPTLTDAEREATLVLCKPGERTDGCHMTDIVLEIRAYLATIAARRPERLAVRLMRAAADEIDRLRITDAEREAIEQAADFIDAKSYASADTLRGLLARLGGGA